MLALLEFLFLRSRITFLEFFLSINFTYQSVLSV